MKRENYSHQTGFLSFEPLISVNIKNLCLGTETPLLRSGRAAWRVSGIARVFILLYLRFGDSFHISICHFDWFSFIVCLLVFKKVFTVSLSDHRKHMLEIVHDWKVKLSLKISSWTEAEEAGPWSASLDHVPWSASLDPHQSVVDDNSRVRGLKPSSSFPE